MEWIQTKCRYNIKCLGGDRNYCLLQDKLSHSNQDMYTCTVKWLSKAVIITTVVPLFYNPLFFDHSCKTAWFGPKGQLLVLSNLYFKTTCNIRPHFLCPMAGLKIEGPLYLQTVLTTSHHLFFSVLLLPLLLVIHLQQGVFPGNGCEVRSVVPGIAGFILELLFEIGYGCICVGISPERIWSSFALKQEVHGSQTSGNLYQPSYNYRWCVFLAN